MIKTSFLTTEYQKHTRDVSAANLVSGKARIDHHYTFLLAESDNYIVERTKYGILKDGQRSYLLPPDYIQMKTIRVKNSAGDWIPLTEIPSLDRWQAITTSSTHETDVPELWTVINEQGRLYFELHPLPNADGDLESPNLEIVYEGYQDRLLFPADYSTGTIAITNGSASVALTDGVFPAGSVGRFILPTDGKYWYEIKTRTSDTAAVLVNYFQETTITAQGFTIAEMMRLPAEFHMTPVWGAVWDYYMSNNAKKANEYKSRYLNELTALRAKYQKKSKGAVIRGIPVRTQNPGVPRNYPRTTITRIS